MLLNGVTICHFCKKYVFDASNAPVDNISWRSLKWAESMQEFDKEKYTLFRQIVDDMMLDKEMIPDFPSEPLHIWETWASNLIAARMVIEASKHEYGETANALWRGFVQPTGFDPCDIVFLIARIVAMIHIWACTKLQIY